MVSGSVRTVLIAAAVVPLLSGVAGCSTGPHVVTADKEKVARELSDQFKEAVGRAPDSVTSPEDLKGVEGTTLRCELTDGGKTYDVVVTVTGVEGDDIKFKVNLDDQPR